MLHFYKNHLLLLALLISVGGCQSILGYDNTLPLNKNSDIVSPVTEGFSKWHAQVLASENAINKSKYQVSSSYDTIRGFNKRYMTRYWIDEAATIIAQNPEFKQTIIDLASQDKYAFANNILNNYRQVTRLKGAKSAFIDALNHIAGLDYDYQNLSNAFEDFARGRSDKTQSQKRDITTDISMSTYQSHSNMPSVMEQMLVVATVKILEVENKPKITKLYNRFLSNIPVENCLHHAQQNSAQCKAASYDQYDLSFCMAKHAIGETAQCFSWILP